jgi:hypothetical protein
LEQATNDPLRGSPGILPRPAFETRFFGNSPQNELITKGIERVILLYWGANKKY